MNWHGVKAIYTFRNGSARRTLWQSLSPRHHHLALFPGLRHGHWNRMSSMSGVEYGSFIVPGTDHAVGADAVDHEASFGIFFPKFTGTIYETLSAPITAFETTLAYVGRSGD
jgi:ABC-2 type transport system permease protein